MSHSFRWSAAVLVLVLVFLTAGAAPARPLAPARPGLEAPAEIEGWLEAGWSWFASLLRRDDPPLAAEAPEGLQAVQEKNCSGHDPFGNPICN